MPTLDITLKISQSPMTDTSVSSADEAMYLILIIQV